MRLDEKKQNTEDSAHYPVMLQEVLESLKSKDGGIYVDCTFGAGGYSKSILESSESIVLGIDQDPSVLIYSEKLKAKFNDRFIFAQRNFSDLKLAATDAGFEKVDGIVFDLGVSSMQLDHASRGFSFAQDAELDMRMSQQGLSAKDWINTADEREIADIIYKYGDETYARKIAAKIITTRKDSPITTTIQLANLVREIVKSPSSHKIDKATKTFQAIRIYINNELGCLEKALSQVFEMLKIGGKLLVVSFHSTEDKIVKEYIKSLAIPKVAKSKYAPKSGKTQIGYDNNFALLTPTRDEILRNPRSRSAKLRIATKVEVAL